MLKLFRRYSSSGIAYAEMEVKMIEIIYREDDDTGEEISVKLPKNINQIGDTKGNKKVYFEELVMEAIKEKLCYGVLLGKVKKVGACSYIFINGAVYALGDRKNVNFDDKVWTGIYDDIHSYFHNLEIIGWFLTEDSKTMSLENIKKIQLDNFPGNDRICILNDISENEEKLYQYNNGVMENIGGYYIYFDKNQEFEKYLVKSKALEELFEAEEKNEISEDKKQVQEKTDTETQLPKFNYKAMIPSYMVIALLLAIIVVMNNYGQISSIKASLSDIAGNLVNNPVTEQEPENIHPVVENLPGEVETTTKKKEEVTTKKQDETTGKKNEATTGKQEKTTKKQKETAKKEEESTEKADIKPVTPVQYYTVKKGETLSDISRKIYDNLTMVEKIMKVNNIKDPNLILEGQKIILP